MEWTVSAGPVLRRITDKLYNGRTSAFIVDREERIIVSLMGSPNNDWESTCQQTVIDIEAAAAKCRFTDQDKQHRRGSYPALAYGISFGGGQTVRILFHCDALL
jgi:hypothetical protein